MPRSVLHAGWCHAEDVLPRSVLHAGWCHAEDAMPRSVLHAGWCYKEGCRLWGRTESDTTEVT